jgi:hypothetical protein
MIAVLLLMLGCTEVPECLDDGDCEDLDACIEGTCTVVECLTSRQCDLHTHCERSTHTCDPGCESADDCYAGEWCDSTLGVCEPLACEDTQLDCPFGETCERTTGECYDDGRHHCTQCYNTNACGTDGTCFTFTEEGGGPYYCLMQCTNPELNDCPQGYTCQSIRDVYYCLAWCPYLDSLGLLD